MHPNVGVLFSILPVLLLVRFLRRFLDLPHRLPRASQLLGKLWVPGVALFAVALGFRWHTSLLADTYLIFAVGAVLVVLASLRQYRPARTLLVAIGPYYLYSMLELVLAAWPITLTERAHTVVSTSHGFALLWLLAFGLVARSQKKALEKERLQREEEEKAKQLIAAQNVELERLVAERTAALTRQAQELRETLTELKAAQDQLIQAEKMASLGELTAGIAHEIQNPLNFVNNFSEISVELLEELTAGPLRQLPAAAQKQAAELISDLVLNLQKITSHGKRADNIVKGMLEHSRASTGERRPTNLNLLAEEYLHLSYHGLRAKDNTFSATLTTDFDPQLLPVEVVGQEIGRVLLNMFTNAFYAVQQRQKLAQPGYQPEVQVSTRQQPEEIELRVRDNGQGIPESVLTKVFQPFFTTKPTGQGTGLGLSISHDIIVKGYGGTLQVKSEVGQFTEFIITLPVQPT